MDNIFPQLQEWAALYGLQIIAAILILIAGLWVAKFLKKFTRKVLTKKEVDPALVSFLSSIVYAAMIAFIIITVLAKVGIQTASFIAVLGAAGLAIGLAFQGALSNFAAGVLLLIFRPFKAGQFINASGTMGTVEEIQLLYTQLKAPDNVKIIVPNGKLMADIITNYSENTTRRAEWKIGVGYNDDLKKARRILEEILKSDKRILDDPAPSIFLVELADSSVNFSVRAYTNAGDWWATYTDTLEVIKERFDQEGINIPFPQRDVHLFQAS